MIPHNYQRKLIDKFGLRRKQGKQDNASLHCKLTMGVPAFFRWLSRKNPSILVHCIEEKVIIIEMQAM